MLEAIFDALQGDATEYYAWTAAVVDAARRSFGASRVTFEITKGTFAASDAGTPSVLRLVGYPSDDSTILLSIVGEGPIEVASRHRAVLAEIAIHLENGVRLRRHPERITGLLSAEGELLDGQPGWTSSRLWRALVEGRATLSKPSRKAAFYAVLDAPPSWSERRALSTFEARLVTLAVKGMTSKALAHESGVSCSRVSHALRRAATKLGLLTSCELVRIASGLVLEEPARIDSGIFTDAEREIVELVRSGLSNRAIAEIRGRSPRTIANQVASVLRKTTCPSRRALAAMRVIG
ncbi:MAG: helix-turn-helix transcriptional regulator [Labilithrix sp.]|nr:helix-turn-helix transcriptional regulator [Labilithrix sp.]